MDAPSRRTTNTRGDDVDLLDLIGAFNDSATPAIQLRPTRDGELIYYMA